MRLKQVLKFIFAMAILSLIICWIGHTIKENKQKITTIFLDKEPDFISTSNGDELLTVTDGEIVSYGADGNSNIIELDVQIAKVYSGSDWLWIIDNEANLYTLQVIGDNSYEISDVILENVTYVEGNAVKSVAITTNGEVYVWGRDDEYYSLGLGDVVEAKEPTKVEGIRDAKEVASFHVNTAILTETGELYVAGGIITSEWSEEKQESIITTEYIKEFKKVKHDSIITHMGEFEGLLYTMYEDGTILDWSGIEINDDGDVVLDSLGSNWACELRFNQISFGTSFSIGLDGYGDIYFWGFDFTRKMRSKADYTIYTTPQLIQFDKDVDSVYAVGKAAFLKSGLKMYIMSN